MRIAQWREGSAWRNVKWDVRRARRRGPLSEPVCVRPCPDYDPATGCHWLCHAAAQRLSGDPANPLEPTIVPIAFELKRLGVFCPCWSCEGTTTPAVA